MKSQFYTHLAKLIKNVVKIYEDLAFRNLGNVVHGLARVISDPSILIRQAR